MKTTIRTFVHAWNMKENDFSIMTRKRRVFLVVALPLFLTWQLFNGICFWLDDILYPQYSKVKIHKPVFILGPTRSGTSFLFRTLALDKKKFTSMQLWEILFAPAIIQKEFWFGIAKFDHLLGAPFRSLLEKLEAKLFQKMNQMHKTSLFLPEEDAFVWIHQFSSLYLYVLFPNDERLKRFGLFDKLFSEEEKAYFMNFYKKCLQKHLYVFGHQKQMLSKSPILSSKTQSILSFFANATILIMKRDAVKVIPSSLSFYHYLSSQFSKIKSKKKMYAQTKAFLIFWSKNTSSIKSLFEEGQIHILDFKSLTKQPKQSILELYAKLGFKPCMDFEEILEKKERQSRNYKSSHKYSLEEFGLTGHVVEKDLNKGATPEDDKFKPLLTLVL